MKEHLWDTAKVGGATILGIIPQLTQWDLFFKVSLGFLSCCYISFKCVEAAISLYTRFKKWRNNGE